MDMNARKYSKTQGAFTSVDELWRGQMDYSPYAYSFHDPINFMDPSGMAGGGNSGGSDGTTDGSLPGKGGVYIWTGSGLSPFHMINGFSEDEARSIRARLNLDASWRRLGDFMSQYAPLVQQPKPIDKYTHPDHKYSQPSSTQVAAHPGTWDPTELLHLGLDFLGFAPGIVGVIADAVNGLLYLVEGEFKSGGLTLLAIIPGLDGLKGLKFAGKAGKTAFDIAQQGGKHAGFLKNYLGRHADEIEKAINTLQTGKRGIDVHIDKIANPSKYVPDWNSLRPEHRQNLIRGWEKEIVNASEQIEILKGILRQ